MATLEITDSKPTKGGLLRLAFTLEMGDHTE